MVGIWDSLWRELASLGVIGGDWRLLHRRCWRHVRVRNMWELCVLDHDRNHKHSFHNPAVLVADGFLLKQFQHLG